MSITISIVKSPAGVANQHTSMVFSDSGGCLGRGNDNNWVLDDPERFMSSRHSEISCENGQYYLTDLSTNGTFLNGAPEPIGKGNRIALKNGDVFSLSDYEFQVSVQETGTINSDSPFAFGQDTSGIEVDFFEDNPSSLLKDPFETGFEPHISSAEPVLTATDETDPLRALDNAHGIDAFQETYFDQAVATNHTANDWPSIEQDPGMIPDDWDDDLLVAQATTPKTETIQGIAQTVKEEQLAKPHVVITNNDTIKQLEAENQLLIEENKKLQADVDLLAKQIRAKQRRPNAATAVDHLLLEAMGLSGKSLSEEKVMEISQTIGELMRETVSGLMQVLTSRSTVKNEFRMNVTTIQPVENNPLKFSANIEDALENMFLRESQAYKGPVESVREGFQSIAEHQVAIIAGIRAAFRGVISRFDPIALEQRFEKYRKAGLLQVVNKGKNWDSYKDYYNELVNDMDNSFQHLFGYDFVQAYEDQLLKLTSSRRGDVNFK